jgi:hypothetical protein
VRDAHPRVYEEGRRKHEKYHVGLYGRLGRNPHF